MATFDRSVSRVTGSLARYAAGFTAELAAQGYGEASIYLHLRLVADLSVWLSSQGLGVEQLSPAVADRFVLAMRVTKRRLSSARGLAPFTGYLDGLDVLPEPDLAAASERDALVSAYQRYLRAERGVCERTVRAYTPSAVAFLAAVGDPLDAALACLSGPKVLDILHGQLNGLRRCRSAAGTKLVAQADRSLLRFLYAVGHTSRELALVVPRVARWRLAGLPARLDAATIAALLVSCDRGTETGRRDYAVLLILVRLGLRSCEVTRLTLDDLNWRAGEITIHGKGDQVEAFPLPWDVGEALVDYLHVRRAANSSTRTVFLTVLPPYRELTIHGLGSIRPAFLPAGGRRRVRPACPAALAGQCSARGGRVAGRCRGGPSARRCEDDGHLRQGRPDSACRPGAAMARTAGARVMTTLRQAAEDYLALRRSMGFQLAVPGHQVQQFADYLDALAATHVTIDLAVAWATQPAGAAPSYH